MEKIIKIESGKIFKSNKSEYEDTYEGYIIITDKQTIKIGIANSQECCEIWGYLTTNDYTDEFIGAELISIERVNTALDNKEVPELEDWEDEANTMFINLNTSAGTLQFIVYNSHNGYYGHDAVLISKQLNIVTNL